MDLARAIELVLIPGLSLLPETMRSPEAIVMLLTIAQQESRFRYRKQLGGPAHGFYQFESIAVREILRNPQSKDHAEDALKLLKISKDDAYTAIVYNDTLATIFARLYLYLDPKPLPTLNMHYSVSWDYYLRTWRPGKPHPHTWEAYHLLAKEAYKLYMAHRHV